MNLEEFLKIINYLVNPDTLRYFFSSIFQGFAAIITLGAMYYLYYFEKTERTKLNVEKNAEKILNDYHPAIFRDQELHSLGLMIFLISKYLPEREYIVDNNLLNSLRKVVDKYKKYEALDTLIRAEVFRLFKRSIVTLTISMISILFIGFNNYLDVFLLLIGIFIIVYSIIYFKKLKHLLKITIEYGKKLPFSYEIEIPIKESSFKRIRKFFGIKN